jgi:hypothetical protein
MSAGLRFGDGSWVHAVSVIRVSAAAITQAVVVLDDRSNVPRLVMMKGWWLGLGWIGAMVVSRTAGEDCPISRWGDEDGVGFFDHESCGAWRSVDVTGDRIPVTGYRELSRPGHHAPHGHGPAM